MRLIDADELAVESIDITDLPTDHGLMVYRAEEVDDAPTVNAIVIPTNATNGDVIKALFPKAEVFFENQEYGVVTIKQQCEDAEDNVRDDYVDFSEDFWCTPYGKEFK